MRCAPRLIRTHTASGSYLVRTESASAWRTTFTLPLTSDAILVSKCHHYHQEFATLISLSLSFLGLGHTCHKNSDCAKGTRNSKCGNMSDQKNTLIVVKASVRKHNEKHKLVNQNKPKPRNFAYSPNYSASSKYSHIAKTGYRSASRQSKLTKNFKESASNSCRCSAEYRESDDRTVCVKVETPKRSSSVVQLSPLVYPIASASNSINHRIIPKLPLASSQLLNSSLNVPPVSIGKRCRNSAECRLRDPYTFCTSEGICDCMNRNSKCNAQNNTGCYPDTFQCRDGTCISWYFVCDGNQYNCEDNSDETECIRFNCPKEAFQCDDGYCISKAKVCDNRVDCSSGEDEAQCKRHQCAENLSFQSRDGQCLPLHTFCNGLVDAADRSVNCILQCFLEHSFQV